MMWSSLVLCAVLALVSLSSVLTKQTSAVRSSNKESRRRIRLAARARTGGAGTTGGTGNSTKSCFSGMERVSLSSGATRLISEVRVGDVILAADSSFVLCLATVIAVPHVPNYDRAVFLELVTASGSDLRVTPDHLLLAGSCDGSSAALTLASTVSVGDCLLTVSGPERVESKRTVHGVGLYSVVTDKEFIVVNGIIASPFAVNHAAAHAFYRVHRLLFRIMPSSLKSGLITNALILLQDMVSVVV